jgi:hypothetical protein
LQQQQTINSKDDDASKNKENAEPEKPSFRIRILIWFHENSMFDETAWNEVQRFAAKTEKENEEKSNKKHNHHNMLKVKCLGLVIC